MMVPSDISERVKNAYDSQAGSEVGVMVILTVSSTRKDKVIYRVCFYKSNDESELDQRRYRCIRNLTTMNIVLLSNRFLVHLLVNEAPK